MRNNLVSIGLIAILLVAIASREFIFLQKKEQSEKNKKIEYASAVVTKEVITKNLFPDKVQVENETFKPLYSLNSTVQEFTDNLLKRYPSDYTSIVIIDNNTGGILALSGIQKENKERDYSLALSASHPAASLFKIVASADLIENADLDKNTVFNYRGRGTTLYKYQLTDKKNKWTRFVPFKKAFAFSNNVIFGKAAIKNTTGFSLYKTAKKFGFNQSLMPYLNLPASYFVMPESEYHLAELASGLNRATTLSPVHAAALSSVIANDGYLLRPYLISGFRLMDGQEILSLGKEVHEKSQVLSKESAKEMKSMMKLAIEEGTARRVFRKLKKEVKESYELGAKTGSITGGEPFGKRDWLTFFVKPVERSGDRGISVAIMNINKKKWYYKSTFLALKIISFYHKQKKQQL